MIRRLAYIAIILNICYGYLPFESEKRIAWMYGSPQREGALKDYLKQHPGRFFPSDLERLAFFEFICIRHMELPFNFPEDIEERAEMRHVFFRLLSPLHLINAESTYQFLIHPLVMGFILSIPAENIPLRFCNLMQKICEHYKKEEYCKKTDEVFLLISNNDFRYRTAIDFISDLLNPKKYFGDDQVRVLAANPWLFGVVYKENTVSEHITMNKDMFRLLHSVNPYPPFSLNLHNSTLYCKLMGKEVVKWEKDDTKAEDYCLTHIKADQLGEYKKLLRSRPFNSLFLFEESIHLSIVSRRHYLHRKLLITCCVEHDLQYAPTLYPIIAKIETLYEKPQRNPNFCLLFEDPSAKLERFWDHKTNQTTSMIILISEFELPSCNYEKITNNFKAVLGEKSYLDDYLVKTLIKNFFLPYEKSKLSTDFKLLSDPKYHTNNYRNFLDAVSLMKSKENPYNLRNNLRMIFIKQAPLEHLMHETHNKECMFMAMLFGEEWHARLETYTPNPDNRASFLCLVRHASPSLLFKIVEDYILMHKVLINEEDKFLFQDMMKEIKIRDQHRIAFADVLSKEYLAKPVPRGPETEMYKMAHKGSYEQTLVAVLSKKVFLILGLFSMSFGRDEEYEIACCFLIAEKNPDLYTVEGLIKMLQLPSDRKSIEEGREYYQSKPKWRICRSQWAEGDLGI